jgi:hypothetical protein
MLKVLHIRVSGMSDLLPFPFPTFFVEGVSVPSVKKPLMSGHGIRSTSIQNVRFQVAECEAFSL